MTHRATADAKLSAHDPRFDNDGRGPGRALPLVSAQGRRDFRGRRGRAACRHERLCQLHTVLQKRPQSDQDQTISDADPSNKFLLRLS